MPRNPPPEFPVRTYPTPNISDQVLIEFVTSELANSKPLVPGTAHPNTREFQGYKLGAQKVNPADHNFFMRLWVTDETNPDAWNFAIKYTAESVNHPIYIRAYREPKNDWRATYGRARNSPDPDFANAILVAEEAQQFPTDSEFFSLYFNVIRVYQTLPGPGLTTQQIGQENLTPAKYLRLVTHLITEQEVSAALAFPSGLTGDQVFIEQAMQTIVVARKKIVEEVINTDESPLRGSDLNKWGRLSIYETVVDEGTAPDEGFLVKASTVTPFGNGKAAKITVTYPANLAGVELPGQEIDQAAGGAVFPFVERLAPTGTEIGDALKEITPIDYQRELVRTVDPSAIAAALGSYVLSFPGTTNLNLPDVLQSIDAVMETTQGDGDYSEDGFAEESNSGASLSIRGTGQASAAILPDVSIQIKQIWGNNIPTVHYLFFMPMPLTAAAVLAKLIVLAGATVNAWPKFVPMAHTLILVGGRLSLQVQASSQVSFSDSTTGFSNSYSTGTGASREVGLTVKTVRIPPTIHGTINISGNTSDTESLTADAAANIPVNGDVTRSEGGEVAGSIEPTSLAATSPTSIPSSGLYLLRTEADPYKWGYARVHCEVVDFANVG